MTNSDIFKTIFRFILVLQTTLVTNDAISQTTGRTILQVNGIKKILTYKIEKPNGPKYLTKISFVDDSGLIYKSISLNEKQDTIYRVRIFYDSLNREKSEEIVYNKDSTLTRKFEYPTNDSLVQYESFLGRNSKQSTSVRTKRKKVIYSYYTNDNLVCTIIDRHKRHQIQSLVIRSTYPKRTRSRQYLDSNGNVVKNTNSRHHKERQETGGYTIENSDGLIEKDKTKYSTFYYKYSSTITHEYNELGLRIKSTFESTQMQKSRSSKNRTSKDFSSLLFDYMK